MDLWILSSFSGSVKAVASSKMTMGASFKIVPGDGDALALSARELLTRVPGGGVPAVLQTADELLTLGCPGGGEHLLV